MKNVFLLLFFSALIISVPSGFAQTTSNTDFNPFPQMEQDMQNQNDTALSQQQNDQGEDWPTANSDSTINSDGPHE